VHAKSGCVCTNLHGVTCQKVALFAVTLVYLVMCYLHFEEDLMPFYERINVCGNFRVISWASATISDSNSSITGALCLIIFPS
jgi:hypothetical protein